MVRAMEMRGGVPVRRLIAAADVAAGQTQAKVHPFSTDLEAFLAAIGSAWIDILYLAKMRAAFRHAFSLVRVRSVSVQ